MSKKLQQTLTLLCAISILSNQAIADPIKTQPSNEITCKDVIEACDKALEAKDHDLQLSNLALVQTRDALENTAVQLDDAESKLHSIWRNPWLYFGLGLVGGVLLTK